MHLEISLLIAIFIVSSNLLETDLEVEQSGSPDDEIVPRTFVLV